MSGYCQVHEVDDCDFRGPCGDLRFLTPVARAVAESNRPITNDEFRRVLRAALDFAAEESGNWSPSVSPDYREGFRAALRCALEVTSGGES